MVFALLIAAIIWNLGTWYLGLPASSSHTLIGSIIGVGVANALMHGQDGTSGVDWTKATEIGSSLLLSPIFGFRGRGIAVPRLEVRGPQSRPLQAAEGQQPPPWWIRGILILTCTGVSFAHGSNDGQKGMGLIMLILIGTVPTAYALNRAMPAAQMAQFTDDLGRRRARSSSGRSEGFTVPGQSASRRSESYVSQRKLSEATFPSLAGLMRRDCQAMSRATVRSPRFPPPPSATPATICTSPPRHSGFCLKDKGNDLTKDDVATLTAYKRSLDEATKFIPLWVKVAVAIALGLGTMIGWKRIVVTVGEKIGKSHLTYAQGASAELVAACDHRRSPTCIGLPVSTTHVLSSGVAGTMAANGSGLQWATVRNLLMAWVLTLPAAITLSATLYYVCSSHLF